MSPTVPEGVTAPRRRFRRSALLAAVVVLCAACDRDGETGVPTAEARTYTVRGAVRGTEGELTLQHEAIPDFVGPGGEVEPMHAMTMSFPVGPAVDLEGLSLLGPGAPVEFDLHVDWSASPPVRVVAVRPLPTDTELQLAGH